MSLDDMKDSMKPASDGRLLQLGARWATILGVPLAIFILTQAVIEFRLMRDDIEIMSAKQSVSNVEVAKIAATLDQGYGPRIARLEGTQAQILQNLSAWTADRFTKADAREMRDQLQREIQAMINQSRGKQ
jgi:hypothetical protein